jgi:hypothetical protein
MAKNPNVPPSVTFPSPNEWPNTIKPISGILSGSTTQVRVMGHGFTALDVNVTTVDFHQVKGMTQINGLPGRIISIVDTNNFDVAIDSTNFYPYTSAGVISVVTGMPPIETASFQTFNTPFQNIA